MRSGLRAATAAVVVIASSVVMVASGPAAHATDGTVTRTPLPPGAVGDVLVDDGNGQVFTSMSTGGSVVVTGLNGQITATVTGLANPGGMTLSGDGSTVYVTEGKTASLAAIDTVSHAVTHKALPEGTCPVSVTFTGGKVWYSYFTCSDPAVAGIGVFDPASGTASNGVFTVPVGHLRALPSRPDRLALLETQGVMHVYDVSATPAVVVEGVDAGDDCEDAALYGNGDHLVTSCRSQSVHWVYATADLALTRYFGHVSEPVAATVSPQQRFAAVAYTRPTTTGYRIYRLEPEQSGSYIHEYGTAHLVVYPGTLAFSDGGHMFAAVDNRYHNRNELMVFHNASKYPSYLTLTRFYDPVDYGRSIHINGILYFYGESAVVSITAEDRLGTRDLGTVTVSANGKFSITDTPRVSGRVTYRARYQGDDMNIAASWATSVTVRTLPYDVNGDGYADTVVGVPGEDLGSVRDAGMVHVFYGGADGPTGGTSTAITQESAGVPGVSESGDRFGSVTASGDFNADGFADIAVSAPGEDVGPVADGGTLTDGGAVWIFYGGPDGLSPAPRGISAGDVSPTLRDGAKLGHALVVGDFDQDVYGDLAIGAPGAGPGYVVKARGSSVGLSDLVRYDQNSTGIPGYNQDGDRFGASLAAGDLDNSGPDELVVGAPGDREDRGWATGSATAISFYPDVTGKRWSKDTTGVPGGGGSYNLANGDSPDSFGHRVAVDDINGDDKPDLLVTAPGSPVTVDGVRKRDAGTVTVLYSGTTTDAVELSQQSAGIPGISGQEDHFGSALATGDTNGDGTAEWAVYSPGDTYVTVVAGASARTWTQNSSGIPGVTESGDDWGRYLRYADVKGNGYCSLVVGAPGENSAKGAFTVIHGTSTGLTGTGAQYVSQDTSGVPGTAESGDRFGTF